MTAILTLLRRFWTAAPITLPLGLGLAVATLAAGLGLLAASGWLITGAALSGLGLIVFDTFRPSAAIRFFAIARTVARYGERLVSHEATFRILANLRVTLFRGLAHRFRPGMRTGRLFDRLTADLEALDGLHLRFAAPVATAAVILVGAGFVLSAISGLLAVGVLAPLVLLGVALPLALGTAARRDARRRHHALDALRSRIAALDRGRTDLLVAGRMGEAVATAERAAARVRAIEGRLHRRDLALRIGASLAGQLALVAAALLGAGLVASGALSGPAYAALILAAFALGEAIAPLRTAALDYGRLALAARRLDPLAADAPATAIDTGTGSGRGEAPAIVLEGVSFAWDAARGAAVQDLSLTIAAGERVALVGPSGSGKSTVLALLSGLVTPSAGRLQIGGYALVRPGLSAGSHTIGLLSQRVDLFRETVGEAVRLGAPSLDEAAVSAGLAAAGLPIPADRLLGDGGSGLSGGERRRLGLARLMLAAPDLVLLDEPTGGVDAETARAVLGEVSRFASGRTLVIATHHADEAALADRLVAIETGRIVADVRRGEAAFQPMLDALTG